MPDTNILEQINRHSKIEFYQGLSKRSRQHFREDIRKHENKFECNIIEHPSSVETDHWFDLYLNVKRNSLELNTFELPKKLFYQFNANPNWEAITLQLKGPFTISGNNTVCIVWCYKTTRTYIPMIIGLDYTYNRQFSVYRQALYQIVLRAKELDKEKIFFGFSAAVEKKKLGAKQIPIHAYMQYKDGFNMEVLSGISINKNTKAYQ